MLSKLYSPSKRDDGFTLIELLVVVVIIGILAAIALPIFSDYQRAAIDASVKSDVRNTVGEVNGYRATHNANLPDTAEKYVADDGKITTSPGAYVNVAFTSDGNFTVCGYNHGGKKYTSYQSAWAFDSSTGHFGDYVSSECVNAINLGANPQATPTTDPTPTRDPEGKYVDPTTTPDPTGGTGGTPAGGSGNTPATCPATNDAAVQLAKGALLDNMPQTYLTNTRLAAEVGIQLDSNQQNTYQTQQDVMKNALNWYKGFAADHSSESVDANYASELHQAADADGNYYYSNSDYSGDYDQPDSDSSANIAVHVYDWSTGYTFEVYIGSTPQDFTASWYYDVSSSTVGTANADVTSYPAILNTDGNQTTGYFRNVTTTDNDSYNQYAPQCGQTQKFGANGDTTDPTPGNDPGGDPGPGDGSGGSSNSGKLNIDSSNWLYSFDGPTASDEVAKKGEYGGMCYFDVNDPANAQKWPFGNELCQTLTQDGTDNPEFGTQLIRVGSLTGSDFPSSNKLTVTGDFGFINGQYTCSAGDGVHVLSRDENIFTTDFLPYGPHYEYRGGNVAPEDFDVTDYWTVSTYEQCDTTTKTAQVAILITYPTDVTHVNGAGGGGHTVGGAVFNFQGHQYRISTSGATRFNRNDIFDRTSRALPDYPNGWYGQHIYVSCSIPADERELAYCQ